MKIYAILMLAAAALFLILAMEIRRGNTKLIHDYHQSRIPEENKKEYGRAFSKGVFLLAGAMFASGGAALFGENKAAAAASFAVLFVGILWSVCIFGKVQKRFNGGLF